MKIFKNLVLVLTLVLCSLFTGTAIAQDGFGDSPVGPCSPGESVTLPVNFVVYTALGVRKYAQEEMAIMVERTEADGTVYFTVGQTELHFDCSDIVSEDIMGFGDETTGDVELTTCPAGLEDGSSDLYEVNDPDIGEHFADNDVLIGTKEYAWNTGETFSRAAFRTAEESLVDLDDIQYVHFGFTVPVLQKLRALSGDNPSDVQWVGSVKEVQSSGDISQMVQSAVPTADEMPGMVAVLRNDAQLRREFAETVAWNPGLFLEGSNLTFGSIDSFIRSIGTATDQQLVQVMANLNSVNNYTVRLLSDSNTASVEQTFLWWVNIRRGWCNVNGN